MHRLQTKETTVHITQCTVHVNSICAIYAHMLSSCFTRFVVNRFETQFMHSLQMGTMGTFWYPFFLSEGSNNQS